MSLGPYVPGEGNPHARIVFVGEAPGAQEEKAKRPFVGYSGQLLRNTLARVGIPESDVWITNVCHYRPPGNQISRWIKKRGGHLVPDKVVADGVVELYHELAEINPTVIVPLGNVALWALCGVQAIAKRRGSIMSVSWDLSRARALNDHGALSVEFVKDLDKLSGTKVIPTLHPAYVLRQMEALAIFQTDLKRIREDATFRELRLPERNIIIDPTGPELTTRVDELLKAGRICFDLECIGYRLYCIGFASDPSWALVLTAENPEYRSIYRELLGSRQPKVAQNGLFDSTYLPMYGGVKVENFAFDTMVAQHAAYPSLPKGLDFLCSVYTREPYYKDEGKNWNPRDAGDVERFLTYNGKDVCCTLEIADKQEANELKDPGYRLTFDRVMIQMPVYAEQIMTGIRVDLKRMAAYKKEYAELWIELQQQLDKGTLGHLAELFQAAKAKGNEKQALAIETFIRSRAKDMGTPKGAVNVNSPKLLASLLFGLLGMKEKRDRKSGKVTTDEDALKELFAETNNPILLTIVRIRQYRKRLSSYLSVKTDARGVTHFSANPVKAKTGRSSYGKTITGEGLNMQTVPHELRDMYIPDLDGYKFAYFDLDQAEARIVAYRGGITRMIKCFESKMVKYTPTDVHSLTAHEVLGVPYEQLKEYPHRYLGKRSNHAFNYEMGPEKFYKIVARDAASTGVTLTRKQAKAMREKHLQTYPELMNYWEDIRGQLRHNRTLINPMGRKRVFLGRLDADTFREAFSHYAQSTVADVLRSGMVAVHNGPVHRFRSLGYAHTRVVLEGHDAILLQYHEEVEHEIIPEVKQLMTIPFEINEHKIAIPVGCEVGWNYGSRDEKENPKGLTDYEPARAS